MTSLCILISSCDKYRHLAEWTASRIGRMWPGHPPVFFSGLTVPFSPECLSFSGDSRDWMGITLQAVETLMTRGFSHVYLVLDDLPPVGFCHAQYLNEILPEYAGQLDASLVSLLGWGQHRPLEGRLLGPNTHGLEHVPAENRWRYSLHPGLWKLEALCEILRIRCRQFGPGERTPWNFERHHPSDLHQIPTKFLESCYRIHGRSFVMEKLPWISDAIQSVGCFIVDVGLYLIRITRGQQARQRAAARWHWPYCLYRGPYPIFWSGTMRQGKVGSEWTTFLKYFNPSRIASEWESVRRKL